MDSARRRVLAALPFVPGYLNEWLVSWHNDPAAETRAYAGAGRSVGMEDVRRVQEATQAFSQMDQRFGGGYVRPAVVDFLDREVEPLLNGRYSDEVGGRLMTAASLLTAQAGWEAFDVGMLGLAQMHYGQALRLAKAGKDDLAAARALSILSEQARDTGHPKWAVRLARAGHDAAWRAGAGPRVRAHLLMRETLATALGVELADVPDSYAMARVRRLIRQAEAALAEAKAGDDEPAWISYFGSAEFLAQAGACLQKIGEHDRAVAYSTQAVREFGTRFPRAAQINTVNVASAHLGAGELDAALAKAKEAVPMAKALKSHRTIAQVTNFDKRLRPYASDVQVREWREYMREELHPVAS